MCLMYSLWNKLAHYKHTLCLSFNRTNSPQDLKCQLLSVADPVFTEWWDISQDGSLFFATVLVFVT